MEDKTERSKLRLIEVDPDQYQALQFLRPFRGPKLKAVTRDILKRGLESYDREFPDIARVRKDAAKVAIQGDV